MSLCAVCNGPGTKRCTSCLGVYYCSKEHQKQDWKNHKGTCLPYKIEENAVLGRHMVAARPLARGQLIVKKKPLMYCEVPVDAIKSVADFDIRSPLKHNCCPNCYVCPISPAGVLNVRTVKDIALGEVLTICYANPLDGTRERTKFLKMREMSICNCIRCLDPTELGTHFSSLKCQKTGCNGLLVPPDNDHLSNQPWQCQTCREETSAETVESFISSVRAAHSNVDKFNLVECLDFIDRLEPYLHENHFFLTDIRLTTINSINIKCAQVNWRIALKHCRQLDQLFDKVAQTLMEVRSYILMCMSFSLRELNGEYNQEAKQVEAKAYHLIKFDPDDLQRMLPILARGGRH